MSTTLEVAASIHELEPEAWDRLLGPEPPVFLTWRFFASLEDSGTLGPLTGWQPCFPMVKQDGQLVAAAPGFVKAHSQGEFVFDFAWADLARRLGLRYYPKLMVGVPFTPVSGPRLLTAPGCDRPALLAVLGHALVEICRAMKASGVHVNFASAEEVEALAGVGFMRRLGIQYHWNRGEGASWDDYLARFNSKRRNQLKRERKAVAEQGLRLETLRGGELDRELIDAAFRLYESTVDKFYWGRKYLTPKTFELWARAFPEELELVTARTSSGALIAGAVNFGSGERLYGRYWGCFEDRPFLHFNVCYYHGIEECLRRGLAVFEPGAGGEHKLVRGFEPTLQHSAHFLREEVLAELVGRHLEAERAEVLREREAMREAMGLRGD